MIKRIISLILCASFIIIFASCGAKEAGQDAGEESVSAGISETEVITESATEETAKPETETAKTAKIYLDATEDDFADLTHFIEHANYYFCWENNFDREKAGFSYDIRALLVMIDTLSGTEEFDYGGRRIPKNFHGLIEYNPYPYGMTDDTEPIIKLYRENRSLFDPLFRFEDYDSASNLYYSVDAETVEFVETELFGGKPDRDNLVKNTTSDYDHYCYYCDGRYYFQVDIRTGSGPLFDNYKNKQLEDGRYTVSFQLFGSDGEVTAGLIEKDGERYWKIYSLDWGKS